jgi:DNA-binding Xre family transcriptional regulator
METKKLMMMKYENRLCPECGEKKFALANVKHDYKAPWKDYQSMPIIVDLELYKCGNCGNIAANGADLKKIDQAIETSIRLSTRLFLEQILTDSRFKKKKLADYLGLTPEYLSQLVNEKATPKFQVWNTLKAIAIDPEAMLKKFDPNFDFGDLLKRA